MAIYFTRTLPAADAGKQLAEPNPDAATESINFQIPNIAGINAQTGTTYTLQESDNGKLVTFNNAGAVAVTVPQATTLSAKFRCWIQNLGAGTVTLTPTTSTIDLLSTLDLITNQGIGLFSNAANYSTMRGKGSAATGTVTHTGAALDAHKVVVGNGGADVETIASAGTSGQVLVSGGASADPAFGNVAQANVTGLATSLSAKEDTANKAQINGYAGLDSTGKVPLTQLNAIAVIAAFIPGVYTASQVVVAFPVSDAFTLPAGLGTSVAKLLIAATLSTVFQINKNGSSVGTITFASLGTTGTFALASDTSWTNGDTFSITAPVTPDTTAASLNFSIHGSR